LFTMHATASDGLQKITLQEAQVS